MLQCGGNRGKQLQTIVLEPQHDTIGRASLLRASPPAAGPLALNSQFFSSTCININRDIEA